MVVQNNTYQNAYTGDGMTTLFPYTFRLVETDSFYVYVAGVLQSTSAYTLNQNLSGVGGTVNFAVAPILGTQISLTRLSDTNQLVQLSNNGPLSPQTIVNMADKLTIICQQIVAQLGFGLSAPVSYVGFNGVLPTTQPGGSLLGLNAAGTGLVWVQPVAAGNILVDNGPGVDPSFQPVANISGSYYSMPPFNMNGCRMYMVSGQPYTDSAAAQSALFWGPTNSSPCGNLCSLPNANGQLVPQYVTETNLSSLLVGLTPGTIYDLYIIPLTPTTVMGVLLAWAGNTPPTRGNIQGTPTNVAKTGLWVGAVQAVTATTIQDDTSIRGVSNAYNQVCKAMRAYDPTASRAISSTNFTPDDNNTTPGQGRFNYLQCLANNRVRVSQAVSATNASAGGSCYSGIGVNSVTSSTFATIGTAYAANAQMMVPTNTLSIQPVIGSGFVQRLVYATLNTVTIYAPGTYTEGDSWF